MGGQRRQKLEETCSASREGGCAGARPRPAGSLTMGSAVGFHSRNARVRRQRESLCTRGPPCPPRPELLMLMMRARHPGLGPPMLLMRTWGFWTEPADAHDAPSLGDLWGVCGAIPFCARKTVHPRHGVGPASQGEFASRGSPVSLQVRARPQGPWRCPIYRKSCFVRKNMWGLGLGNLGEDLHLLRWALGQLGGCGHPPPGHQKLWLLNLALADFGRSPTSRWRQLTLPLRLDGESRGEREGERERERARSWSGPEYRGWRGRPLACPYVRQKERKKEREKERQCSPATRHRHTQTPYA